MTNIYPRGYSISMKGGNVMSEKQKKSRKKVKFEFELNLYFIRLKISVEWP